MSSNDEPNDTGEIVEALMQVNAMLEPIVEWAIGFRANLVSNGWPDSIANEISGDVLRRVIAMGMSGGRSE